MIAKERICVTECGGAAVPDGHHHARRLLVGEGCEIDDAVAKRYGLTREGRLPKNWPLNLARVERRQDKAKHGPEETK